MNRKFHYYTFLTFQWRFSNYTNKPTFNPSAIIFSVFILSAQVEKHCVQTKKKKIIITIMKFNNNCILSCHNYIIIIESAD